MEQDVDVVILCGGLGTRLRSVVSDRPKSLASIEGVPFIDILLRDIFSQGLKRIILCVGHLKEKIKEHIKKTYPRDSILFSEEETPLGTGGALKNACNYVGTENFFVLNGDTICPVKFSQVHDFHRENDALVTVVLAPAPPQNDYGAVRVDPAARIVNFKEKDASGARLVNAGIYCMKKDVFSHFPDRSVFSLENDFFPYLASEHFYGYKNNKPHLDIGTPERYRSAGKKLLIS